MSTLRPPAPDGRTRQPTEREKQTALLDIFAKAVGESETGKKVADIDASVHARMKASDILSAEDAARQAEQQASEGSQQQ